ncbi:restriction endonuclease subunit S [Microbacterium sp. Leaf151]|uniref:restriction endonuclease subunit S n=1 Tax=Microbacterium sp. Leaf151 TaxID=1736276 RepID=UPI000AB3343F|nr:restriction endonuclease subunit S [Microbacterium sp. Leaf151]
MTTLADLFDIEYGNKYDMNKMEKATRETGIAFVGRIGGLTGRSGVAGFVKPVSGVAPYRAGLLTVALGGSRLLSSYVQQLPFYTAQNVAVLTPIDARMSLNTRLYYSMCIRANAFRYSAFGREANRTLATLSIPDTVPDWVEEVDIPTHSRLVRTVGPPVALSDISAWKPFALESIFELKKGRRVTKADRAPGTTRFIGASEKHNGITDMCDLDPTFGAHCLTVPYNGNSVGVAFYQDKQFFASDDVQVLIPRAHISQWSLHFIAAVIRFERRRFSYGYKWNLERMKKTEVRLPATQRGAPDWDYMDAVMRGLPFSAAVQVRTDDARLSDVSPPI